MPKIRVALVGLAAAAIAQLGPEFRAAADPIQATYNTTGQIGSTGIEGTPIVSFQGVTSGSLTTGMPFSLGNFVVATPPGGGTTTMVDTPFQIVLNVTSSSGDPALPSLTPVIFNGAISTGYGSGTPTLEADFGSVNIPTIGTPTIDLFTHYLSEGGTLAYALPTPVSVIFDVTSENGGVFTAQAELVPLSAPEPTPLAMLVMAGAAYLITRRKKAVIS